MTSMFKSLAAILSAFLFLSAPVRAKGVDDIVQLDILDGGLSQDGTYLGALRLRLEDGWKTYWRAPGDAGIPPQFDWGRSDNVGAVSVIWPAPEVFDQNGLKSIGYARQVVLPIKITPKTAGQPVRLRGEVDLGVCKDVCIPATLGFDHALDAGAPRNPAIAAALAQRPYSAREAGVSSATCHLKPTADGLSVQVRISMPPAGGAEVAVIEPGNPALWVSPAETTRQGGTLIASAEVLSADGRPFALDRSDLRITVLGARHAVDIRGCSAG